MTMMYLATTGSGSDYMVVGVFSEESLAGEALVEYIGREPVVKPFEVDSPDTSERLLQYVCCIDRDGDEWYSYQKLFHPSSEPTDRSSLGMERVGCGPPFTGYSIRNAEDARRLAAEARQDWLRRDVLDQLPD